MSDTDKVVHGTPPPQEQQAEFASLRSVFDTKTALDRVDAYAKWLFASAAVVGSLGAGLSNSAFYKLHGPSMWLFALAVLCLGICLVQASKSIAPKWVEADYYVLASLRDAVNKQFATRQRLLTRASVFFSLALILAACAPLASLLPSESAPSIHYAVDEKGALDAGLEASDLQAGTFVELRVESSDPKVQVPRTSTIVDSSHLAKLNLKMSAVNSATSNLDLVGCIRKIEQKNCTTELRLAIVQK